MGYCLITGGGDDGRYGIELDFGNSQKAAILAALATAINKNAQDILQTENEIAQAHAAENEIALVLFQLQQTIATGTPAQKAQATIKYSKWTTELAKLKAQNEPLRYKLRQLKFVRASLRKQEQQFQQFNPVQRRQAWCADLTEDRAAGSYVATLEVKGEPDFVLIQPGARAWIPTDGIVTGREIMSPWQAYWNAAVLPGWQKWKPTYRWGTLTAINYTDDTCSVALADATSSAQRLGINQASTLHNVPMTYMTCNAEAFSVGDSVIIRFTGQDWGAPIVIGFVDNPKSCKGWKAASGATIANLIAGTPRYVMAEFDYRGSDAKYIEAINSATLISVDFRIDRGAWQTTLGQTTTADLVDYSGSWIDTEDGVVTIAMKRPGYSGFPFGYVAHLGAPAHLYVGMYLDSGWAEPWSPYVPLDGVLEVRIRLDGEVFGNIAYRVGWSPPYSVACDRTIHTAGFFEQLVYTRYADDGT